MISIIVDAYTKGIVNFDSNKTLLYCSNTLNKFDCNRDYGYTSSNIKHSVSKTLEYSYSNWCMSVLAQEKDKVNSVNSFFRRSKAYWKLSNEDVSWLRA